MSDSVHAFLLQTRRIAWCGDAQPTATCVFGLPLLLSSARHVRTQLFTNAQSHKKYSVRRLIFMAIHAYGASSDKLAVGYLDQQVTKQ